MRGNGIRILTFVPSLLFAIASLLGAQGPRIAPGDTVRVTVRPNVRYVGAALPLGATMGTFLGMAGDSIQFLRSDQMATANTLPPAAVRRIEIPAGQRSHALRGFLGGGLFGFVLGVFVGGVLDGYWDGEGAAGAAVGGAAGALAFGAVGAGVGSLWHSRRWIAVPPESLAPRDSSQVGSP